MSRLPPTHITRESLERQLAVLREIRREMTVFLSGLGTVWEQLPQEIPGQERIDIIRSATTKFFGELEHGIDIAKLEKQESLSDELAKAHYRIQSLENDLATAGATLKREIDEYNARLKQKEADAQQELESLAAQLDSNKGDSQQKIQSLEEKCRMLESQCNQREEENCGLRQDYHNMEINSKKRADDIRDQAYKAVERLGTFTYVSTNDIVNVLKKIDSL